MKKSEVRVISGEPTVLDFTAFRNSPIIIDDTTDIAYYYNGSAVKVLKAFTGLAYGGFYQYEIPTTITISAVDTYYPITGNTAGPLLDMTFASDTLTVGRTGIYMVTTTASYADGGNTNFETAVFINDVKNEMSACHASTTGSLKNNTTGTSIISLTEGDEIQLRIVNHSNTNNVDIEHCALALVSIS